MTMTTPTIHTNGTSARALCEAYGKARMALEAAMELHAEAAPNGRDYYPQGQAAMAAARGEHVARAVRLNAVRDELLALEMHAADFL
jgi:hypothetical protein